MDKYFRILFLFGIIVFIAGNAWALPAMGDQIRMDYGDIYQMTITSSTDPATVGDVYSSFCLESEVYFSPGSVYEVASVSQYAVGGGPGAGNAGDPVSQETKWIFASYHSGLFSGLGQSGLNNLVQRAIWYQEEEPDGDEDAWNTLNEYSSGDYSTESWDIQVVNLVDGEGGDVQSQLVGKVASVPEPATLLLLGTGLIGMAGMGRRRFKK